MVVELPVGATIISKGNLHRGRYQNSNLIVSQAGADKLVQQGQKLYQAGDFALAVKLLRQAIDKFELSGDTLHQAISLSNLSSAYQKLGLWEDAGLAVATSLNLLQKLNSSSENLRYIAKALDVRGHLELARGKTQIALATWQEAGDIYKSLDDTSGLINNRIDRAQALQILGHFRRANQVLTGLEEVINSQSNFSLKAEGLRNLGNILAVIDDLNESSRVLKLSLENAKYSGSNIEISKTLLSLANLARLQHKIPLAVDYYERAIKRSNNLNIRLQSQLNLISLLIDTKQYTDIELLISQ
ncbi:MAG: hypothetical protein AAFX80_07670, partial [Cyanobacteria bacterium J06639_18]